MSQVLVVVAGLMTALIVCLAAAAAMSADVQVRRVRIAEELQVKLAEIVAGWGGRVLRVDIAEIGSPGRSSIADAAVAR